MMDNSLKSIRYCLKYTVYSHVITIIFLVTFIIFSCTAGVIAAGTKNILVLHSYHQGLVWTDDIMEGIYSVFGKYDSGLDIRVEYMDTKRYFDGLDGGHFTGLRNIYMNKYRAVKLDLIISSDDIAFQFLLMHHKVLFPGVPVVFCGVNDFDDMMLEGHDSITGVIESLDIRSNIDTLLKMHPGAAEIAIITDTTETGKANRQILEQLTEEYKDRTAFIFLDKDNVGLTLQELLDKLSQLPEGSLVYYSDFLRNRGEYIIQETAVPQISAASKNPIYTHYDEILGLGVVGGKLVNGHSHGRKAAQMASDILRGTPVSSLPVHKESINTLMFDYKQLMRFSMDEKDLPEMSLVINRPYSFYQEHKQLVWTLLVIFSVLLTSLITIILNVSKRKKAEVKLQAAHYELEQKVADRTGELSRLVEEKETLLKEIHHRVKNNMTVISSLLALHSGLIKNEDDRHIFDEARSRIKAMAIIHEKLYQSGDMSKISASDYLSDILRELSASYAVNNGRTVIRTDIQDITLSLDNAIPFGLIVNELVSNAMKHAFPGSMQGEIKVVIARISAKDIKLSVADSGVGLPDDLASRKSASLGLNLVDALVRQVHGKLSLYTDSGTRFEITFPGIQA